MDKKEKERKIDYKITLYNFILTDLIYSTNLNKGQQNRLHNLRKNMNEKKKNKIQKILDKKYEERKTFKENDINQNIKRNLDYEEIYRIMNNINYATNKKAQIMLCINEIEKLIKEKAALNQYTKNENKEPNKETPIIEKPSKEPTIKANPIIEKPSKVPTIKANPIIENENKIENLYKLAIKACEEIPIELMKTTPNKNSFANYQQAYNEYLKFYKLANKRTKESEHFKYNQLSSEKRKLNITETEFYIPKPEDVINIINKKVTETLTDKYYLFFYKNKEKNNDTTRLLKNATTYMTVEEIVRLYKTFKEKNNINYSSILKATQEEIDNLENIFLNVIASKSIKNFHELDEKEKQQIKEEIKEIYFQGIQIDNKQVRPKEIKIETEQRFYNMKKVEQTISKIDGTYKRFKELMEKELLTKAEITELNNMFKGGTRK